MSSVLRTALFTFSLTLIGLIGRVYAEPQIQYFGLKTPMRFDHQRFNDSREVKASRYQMQLSADVEVSFTGNRERGLQLATLIGSGDSFTSQWSTLYDHESAQQSPLELSMRQLYLHYLGDIGRFSAGVIPPVKEFVSNTSMDSDGWVRGVRGVIYVGKQGELEGVTGAVDHLNNPSAFQLPSKWNYHELEWTQRWIKSLRTELGVMILRRAHITRGELRYGRSGWWGARYELSGELLYDFKAHRYAYDAMLEIKKNNHRMRFEYSLIDERFGLLGRLVNDYFSLGSVKMVALDGPLPWGRLKWFTRVYHSERVSRGMLGLSYTLQLTR